MTSAKPTHTARRGRIFPQIQWTEEHKAQRRAERDEFHRRCKVIFDRLLLEMVFLYHSSLECSKLPQD